MTIIELIQGDGFFTKHVGSTHGGEYAGPCPWCGGRDRFRWWPAQGEAGKYWCRQCGRSGDAIQYLRDYRHMTYPEACQYLGQELRTPLAGSTATTRPTWEPRVCSSPGELWQRQGRQLVEDAVKDLWTAVGQAALALLVEKKGLHQETIKKFSLGWLPADKWDAAPAWGLSEVLKDNGKPKKLWFPKGLIIPYMDGRLVERIRIRRPEGEPRYYILRGSSSKAMLIGSGRLAAAVVESELDAMLLDQEAGDLVHVVALGNAQARPDREAAELLQASRLILVALDADRAGATEAWGWWKMHYYQAHRWPPIRGKDPGEMLMAGVNLRAWMAAGLTEYGN